MVTFDNVAFGRIEEALKDHIVDEFNIAYISPKFIDRGSEFIRINLESNNQIESTNAYEVREYNYKMCRLYPT